jgi:hypothetical protein
MYLNNLDLELQNNIEIQRRIANKDALSKSVETTLNIDQNIENQAMPSKISEQQQESKQCSYCAELINSAAIKCRYCGSSLLPNVSDKLRIQIKKLTPILKKPEIYAVLIVFTVIVFLFVNSNIEKANKLKDIEQLMVSGKVCASGDFGETFGFGCDKYPVVNLEWCSTDQFLRPFWSEEIYGEYVDVYKSNNGIMVGQKDSRCSSPTPFFHQLSTTVKDLPSGDYDLLSVVYRDIDGNEMIENSRSGDFLLRISR